MNDNLSRLDDLVNNPTARVPICLCLDTSGSMSGAPIDELNEGIKLFCEAIRDDETARYSAEICIITFGGYARLIEDFANIERQRNVPRLFADGMPKMGEAVNMALDCLEKRKQEYKEKGVDYFQPWLVIMTGGKPNGDSLELDRAISRTQDASETNKLTVFPVGIGDGADMNILARFSPKRDPLKIEEMNFSNFFAWLSQSVSGTSQSLPSEYFSFGIEGIKSFVEL